jgi:hypothetical protein
VFRGYEPLASRLASHEEWPTLSTLQRFIEQSCDGVEVRGPRVVQQPPRGRRSGERTWRYDQRIVEQNELPTRERHWHDAMNALVWAAFPRAKRALHERQHQLVSASLEANTDRPLGARSKEHDAIAMLDEGGVLLLLESVLVRSLAEALAQADRAPIAGAIATGRAALFVFGHGILESVLLADHLPNTRASVALLPCERVPPTLTEARALADYLTAEALRSRTLPVDPPWLLLDEHWLATLS